MRSKEGLSGIGDGLGDVSQKGEDWSPNIVAFCCNWCAYAGADLAGVNRRQFSPEFRVVRVMCSGRIAPGMMLKTFAEGADGVMVLGCHLGDCHYRTGNHEAQKRVEMVWKLMSLAGIDESRLLLQWISAVEGELFATTTEGFVAHIRSLGPLRGCPDG